MIELNCPHCGHQLRILDQYAGQTGHCKHCKGTIRVPLGSILNSLHEEDLLATHPQQHKQFHNPPERTPEQVAKNKKALVLTAILVAIAILISMLVDDPEIKAQHAEQRRMRQEEARKAEELSKAQEKPLTEEERRMQELRKSFSAWDGSHTGLVRYVKDRMNDARSFEHVKTTYRDLGNVIALNMRFRGKNAFGALVIQEIAARADIDGNILEAYMIE